MVDAEDTDALLRQIGALEHEVTRLRQANEHLVLAALADQDLRDDAEAANRRQNEFLAMLAHELRNPLVPISMSSMLLERAANTAPQLLNLSKVIRRQVDQMASGMAPQPLAIGLSGYGQAEDHARAAAAGFDHYLVKPVDPNALLALVAASV